MNTLSHGNKRDGSAPFSTAYVRYEMSSSLRDMIKHLYAPRIAETDRAQHIEFRSLSSRAIPLSLDASPFRFNEQHAAQLARYERQLEAADHDEHIPLSANIALASAGRESWALFDILPSEEMKRTLGGLAVHSVGAHRRYIAGVHLGPHERSDSFNESIGDIARRLGTHHPARQGQAFLYPAPEASELWVAQPSLRIKPPIPTILR